MDLQLYNREIEAIFSRFPSFQKVGGSAYKPGLESMLELCNCLGAPHTKFKSLHIAGTNGKGSTSHMIASALSCLKKENGELLKVGLYTSPHLLDFRERMKISTLSEGFVMPSREYVYSFLLKNKGLFEEIGASFFEITTILAFSWFADEKVDIAVVECGLGGRLDATNILTPLLSVITNIGLDHCEFLGSSIESIAKEKAGIIKNGIPVVIGERSNVGDIFEQRAQECFSKVVFAEDYIPEILNNVQVGALDLKGKCQEKNIKTVLSALELLFKDSNFKSMIFGDPDAENIKYYIANAAKITGLHGRWETLSEQPYIVCDTGHNSHGFKLLGKQIEDTMAGNSPFTGEPFSRLVMFFGVVADKDLDSIADYLPKNENESEKKNPVQYYFVNAQGTRALPAENLKKKMDDLGFTGEILGNGVINDSLSLYMSELVRKNDFVFIGGSTFVVAEALSFFQEFYKK